MDFIGNQGNHLPFIEFSYNNNYHSSISLEPFDALSGRICRSRVGWFKVGEFSLLCLGIIHEDLVKFLVIRYMLKSSYSQKKSYADNRRRDLQFEVGDWVYLKISPNKGIMIFGTKGNLSPRIWVLMRYYNGFGRLLRS